MTRRNWFVTLLAPFVAKLSNVGRRKPKEFVVGSNIVLAGPRTCYKLNTAVEDAYRRMYLDMVLNGQSAARPINGMSEWVDEAAELERLGEKS